MGKFNYKKAMESPGIILHIVNRLQHWLTEAHLSAQKVERGSGFGGARCIGQDQSHAVLISFNLDKDSLIVCRTDVFLCA